MPLVAPSILAADLGNLADEIRAVEAAGADWIHIDIMDGHFVPNLTMGPDIVSAVRRSTSLPLDVHLMVTNPLDILQPFAEAGADYISVHCEVLDDPGQACRRIEELGKKPGLVINPPTPVDRVAPFLSSAAMVLVMSVNPGFAGQGFIDTSLPKLTALREIRDRDDAECILEIDGGIKPGPIADSAAAAGADVLVAGSGVFAAADYAKSIATLKGAR